MKNIHKDIHASISEADWEILETTSLRMFGDFSPVDDSLPTNFTQAFHFYHKVRLNGSSAEDWGGTKIKEVTLTPIQVKPNYLRLAGETSNGVQNFCPENGNVVEGASKAMLERVAEMFDKLELLEQNNGGLLLKEPATLFQPIRQNHKLFKNGVIAFRLGIQGKMRTVLPNVMSGTMSEEELNKILGKSLTKSFILKFCWCCSFHLNLSNFTFC